MSFVRDLIDRRIFRYVVAYAAAAWALLQIVDQLVGNDKLPQSMYDAALTFVICGFPGALIVSWFHGAKGSQRMPPIERVLLAFVAVFALVTTSFVSRSSISAVPMTVGLAPTADPSRVAVLYMDARGGEDAEFLAAGLTEALIDQLSAVNGLHVVSRNGSELFRGVSAPPDSIGQVLKVGSQVTGAVSVAGDRVRVDIRLTSSSDGEQIASRRLERQRSEIFALQDELADTVAVFLRSAIGKELGARTLRAATTSLKAWELVQQAGSESHGATVLAAEHATDAASRALARADSLLALAEREDPSWPVPVVRRGWAAYSQSRLTGMERLHNAEWIATGIAHADRALAIAPNNADALELRGTLIYWRYLLNLAGTPEETDALFHEAEKYFRDAISAASGRLASAQNSLSHLLLNKGELAEAKVSALQAYTQDPFLENAHLTIWRIFTASWGLHDTVDAERYCAEGFRRFPDFFRFQQCQLMLPALPGVEVDPARLWALLDAYEAASPSPVQELNRKIGMMYISMALARMGMADSASAVALAARASAAIDPLRELARLESITRTLLGNRQEAVRQLQFYTTANPHALEGLRADARRRELPWFYEALQDEPAFRSLVGVQ